LIYGTSFSYNNFRITLNQVEEGSASIYKFHSGGVSLTRSIWWKRMLTH